MNNFFGCVFVQELRDLLQTQRAWVGGLVGASSRSLAAQQGSSQQGQLLSGLVGALMKCCDPEVSCLKTGLLESASSHGSFGY